MKRIVSALVALAGLVLSGGTACAWHVEGTVLCVSGAPFNNITISVTGTYNCGSGDVAFSQTATADSTGFYTVDLPACAGSFTACVDTSALPSDATLSSAACVSFSTTSANQSATVSWTVTSSVCQQTTSPCPGCVDSSLGLGAAAGCTVLELGPHQVSITGPAGGIFGDICIAPNGKLAMSGDEFVTGTVRLGPGARFQNSSHSSVSVQSDADLSAEIAAAYNAAANAASMPCTQTYATLDGRSVTTITGVSGVNVICVHDVVLSGKQILLTGAADAKFVFNVTGKFVLTGGGHGPQIRVDTSAGLKPSAVLYNIIGSGPDVAFSGGGGGENCCAAIVDGTLLAPYRKIALSPGLVNGEVISGLDISIVSGSSVRCPPCP